MAPPWGATIGLYLILIGIPTGITLVSCWRTVRWRPQVGRIDLAANLLALTILALVGVLLLVDLGRPERSFLMITRFDNLQSPMTFGAKLIAAKAFLLTLDIYFRIRGRGSDGSLRTPADRRTTVIVHSTTWLLGAVSAALAVYPAVLLARTWQAPLAGTAGAMLLFVTTAVLLGVASYLVVEALLLPQTVGGPAGRSLRAFAGVALGLHAVVILAAVLAAIGDVRLDADVLAGFETGSGAVLLWGVGIGVGVVVPAAGLGLLSASRASRVVAAAGMVVGACVFRLLLFAGG